MVKKFPNVFVTVGSTQFDKLIHTITRKENLEVLSSRGCHRLLLQIGKGSFEPDISLASGITVEYYRFKPDIRKDIMRADLVISHAGAGSCIETLTENKPLLVIINDDLMHNHQMEVAKKFHEEGYLFYATCDSLRDILETMDTSKLRPYEKPSFSIAYALDCMMGFP